MSTRRRQPEPDDAVQKLTAELDKVKAERDAAIHAFAEFRASADEFRKAASDQFLKVYHDPGVNYWVRAVVERGLELCRREWP